jgi:D-tyrosyl-tRNA(Tyr) deacylase
MRALVQRVAHAEVRVADERVAAVGAGLLVLLGVRREDSVAHALRLAARVARLRVLADDDGRLDRSVLDVAGEVLVVSQFTLYADTRRGNRPSMSDAAPPAQAEPLYERFCDELAALGVTRVERGRFGSHMQVELVNDGPVTVLLEA